MYETGSDIEKFFLRNKIHHHSPLIKNKFDINPTKNNRDFPFLLY